MQVLAEGGRRKEATLSQPQILSEDFLCFHAIHTACHSHVVLNLLTQDFLATDTTSQTHTKHQAGILWLLALQLVGSEELPIAIQSLFHPPIFMSKTVVFIEQGNIIHSTHQVLSSASITSLLKQNSKLPAEGSLCSTLLFQPSYITHSAADKELSTGDVSSVKERIPGRQQ